MLEYVQWRNFSKVLDRAMLACKNSGYGIADHFAEVSKTIKMPKNANKKVVDFAKNAASDTKLGEKCSPETWAKWNALAK